MTSSLLLATLALSFLLVGPKQPLVPVLGPALAILSIALLRRIQHRHPRNVYLLRIALFVSAGLQLGFWSYVAVVSAETVQPLPALSVLAVILAISPLLYWFPGLVFLVGLEWGLALPFAPEWLAWWLGTSTAMLVFVGWFFHRTQAEANRHRLRERMSLARLEEQSARCMDMEERLLYEKERVTSYSEELAEVRALAEEGSRVKTEFLGTISHEIRTPLNGILPILEILQATPLNTEQQRFVHAATVSSRHLLRIIDDLLDFARAESGKLQLESIPLDLKELADSVLDLMAGRAKRKGLQLKLHIDADTTLGVQGDPVRLRQILTNLLSNAIKFTEHGEVRLTIDQTGSAARGVKIRFSVTDTGVGMAPDQTRGLFSSFTQGDASTTRRYGGTGLGLAICRRLVELLGGDIGVRSTLGQGSTFWFILPMRRSDKEARPTRTGLEGIRIITSVRDATLARRLSEHLRRWKMDETQMAADELLHRLHDAAMLGRNTAYQCLLLDCWGDAQAMETLLREIREDVLLKAIPIVLIDVAGAMDESLCQSFAVHLLNGPYQSETLHRLLCGLYQVVGDPCPASHPEDQDEYPDMNLDRDWVLLPEPDNLDEEEAGHTRPLVLLVEDNPVNLGVVKRVVKRLGAGTLIAHNGRQALDILRTGRQVDMVLMDCQMPVMDGYEATRIWRAQEKDGDGHLPIVAMTANVMPGDAEKCLRAGMDDHLAKPVSIKALARMLGRWTGEQEQGPPTAAPIPAGDDILDRTVVTELREVMEDGFDVIVSTFLESAPSQMDTLQRASRQGDIRAMVAPAHSLKSSSANMGAMPLSSLAGALETAARQGDWEAVDAAQRRMRTLFSATCSALRAELGGG